MLCHAVSLDHYSQGLVCEEEERRGEYNANGRAIERNEKAMGDRVPNVRVHSHHSRFVLIAADFATCEHR